MNVTHNLALHSELQDYRMSFIIVDSPELNAFAAPGGIIGVNGGLTGLNLPMPRAFG